jgi:hypothetical protein
MIHIASVHWKTSAFQDIQFNLVKKNIRNFSFWVFLDKIPESEVNKKNSTRYKFYKDSGQSNHLLKLDMLSQKILKEADDQDIIMFLDGDCWPVHQMDDFIQESLQSYPLVAVVRPENSEPYPHPSFLFTKVEYWRDNGLAWGGKSLNGKKFAINYTKNYMEFKGDAWLPLRRTGGLSDHPVFFSFYGQKGKSMVYHHGAGFRKPVSGFCMKSGVEVTKETSLKMIDEFLKWNK